MKNFLIILSLVFVALVCVLGFYIGDLIRHTLIFNEITGVAFILVIGSILAAFVSGLLEYRVIWFKVIYKGVDIVNEDEKTKRKNIFYKYPPFSFALLISVAVGYSYK